MPPARTAATSRSGDRTAPAARTRAAVAAGGRRGRDAGYRGRSRRAWSFVAEYLGRIDRRRAGGREQRRQHGADKRHHDDADEFERADDKGHVEEDRSEEHTSELQSLMRI